MNQASPQKRVVSAPPTPTKTTASSRRKRNAATAVGTAPSRPANTPKRMAGRKAARAGALPWAKMRPNAADNADPPQHSAMARPGSKAAFSIAPIFLGERGVSTPRSPRSQPSNSPSLLLVGLHRRPPEVSVERRHQEQVERRGRHQAAED